MSDNNVPWWIILFVWMGASTYWHVCKIKQLCIEPALVVVDSPQPVKATPLHIQDSDSLMLTAEGNFGFAKSGAVADLSEVVTQLDSLAGYLLAHPVKRMTIVGYYSATETNSTPYPDLGVARAEGVKQYLVDKALSAGMISTSSEPSTSLAFNSDSLRGGIGILFEVPISSTVQELADAQKYGGIFKPMDLYFTKSDTTYIETEATQQFVEDAKQYLAKNKEKKLTVTEYTGDGETRSALSKEWAEAVKEQLIRRGMPADQIITDGMGSTQPEEPNTTLDGRLARRVTLVIL